MGIRKSNGLEKSWLFSIRWPIFIVLLSLWILKEKLTFNKMISLILGFMGVSLIITKGDFTKVDFGNMDVILMVFLGAVSFALFSVLSKKVAINLTDRSDHLFFYCHHLCVYFDANFLIFYLSDSQRVVIYFNKWLFSLMAFLIYFGFKALQNADASFVAPFIFITPILSAGFL